MGTKGTKKAIVVHAVALFNQKGFLNVAIKDVAEGMGISPGNLTYHFKRKEHLLAAIQEILIGQTSGIIVPSGQYLTLGHFERMFRQFIAVQRDYRFYFAEMPYLLEAYPATMHDYKTTTTQRLVDARKLVDYYITTNRLLQEKGRINYGHVIHSLWATSTFWTLGSALIDRQSPASDMPHQPMEALWGILLPFLTEKGYEEYLEIQQHRDHN